MKKYDYILAGAGCAGLSLAYYLNQTTLRHKSILLIDKAEKNRNDRTWCFWEMGTHAFEPIVCQRWSTVNFYSADFGAALQLAPYQYKMIRSADFYRFVQAALRNNANVTWVQESVVRVEDWGTEARVTTDRGTYCADWVFDSTYQPRLNQPQAHNLLQHFKGWEIETATPVFDPKVATLMDFRIEQHGEARFCYVLPTTNRRALVEFTVFSGHLLDPATYTRELAAYLRDFLRLESYQVLHEEFGVIPMTDEVLPEQLGTRVVRIGTSGGYTKPSTGYTFLRIQERTQALVQSLIATGIPRYHPRSFAARFGWYDSVLLNVMQERRCEARDVFSDLFRKNKASTVLRFLDERTTLAQELRIMASVPSVPFLAAVADVVRKKVLAGGKDEKN